MEILWEKCHIAFTQKDIQNNMQRQCYEYFVIKLSLKFTRKSVHVFMSHVDFTSCMLFPLKVH